MAVKQLGLAALAAVLLAGNAATAVAQDVDATTAAPMPTNDDGDEGKWGLLGLLGLAGLLGLKKRDRDDHVRTNTTGTTNRM